MWRPVCFPVLTRSRYNRENARMWIAGEKKEKREDGVANNQIIKNRE